MSDANLAKVNISNSKKNTKLTNDLVQFSYFSLLITDLARFNRLVLCATQHGKDQYTERQYLYYSGQVKFKKMTKS